MGKLMDGVFVSFENPKGGSGKSTLTAVFAGYLQSEAQKTDLKIGVIDTDDAQNSVGDMRHYEKDFLEEFDYEVMNISSSEILEKNDYLRDAFDIVLIDFPGNLKQDGVIEALYLIDVIIIPFEVNDISLRATLKFYEIYKDILETREKNGFKTTVRGVPNKVSERLKEYKDLMQNKDSLPFKLLENHVRDSKVDFQRNITTLISDYQNNAEKFCEEVLNIITNHISDGTK